MLARKLDPHTLKAVRARADFFFQEQVKRLGPLPVQALMADAALSCPPVLVQPFDLDDERDSLSIEEKKAVFQAVTAPKRKRNPAR